MKTIQSTTTKASEILNRVLDNFGAKASIYKDANYGAYFTRDTVINALGLLYSNNTSLVSGLITQLRVLKNLQGPNGEIPSNFSETNGHITTCSFGSLTPKFDGVCWYIIAVSELVKANQLIFEEWKPSIEKGFACLETLEYNKKGLIYAPIGSDWADEYILSGYVLHIQVLRLWALTTVNQIESKQIYSDKINQIRKRIREDYFIYDKTSKSNGYLIASISPAESFKIFDFASIIIYTYVFNDDEISAKCLNYIYNTFLKTGKFPPVFSPTIYPDNKHWEKLQQFELFGFKNKPGHYHNGGIWWIWLGWYANSLRKNKRRAELDMLKTLVKDKLEILGKFKFSEYLTSDGKEGGQQQMAFSAAGIIMILNNE